MNAIAAHLEKLKDYIFILLVTGLYTVVANTFGYNGDLAQGAVGILVIVAIAFFGVVIQMLPGFNKLPVGYNKAVDRALRAGGDAIGAKCEIRNLPGYLPLAPDDAFREVLRDNAVELFGKEKVTLGEHSSGSTDMGDVSLLMPVIHPWVGCVDGVLHGADYELRDREAAFTRIPQALALTIVDLLADGAQKADEICTAFKPRLDRESYVAFMDDIR